jgi:hypothetical protein
MECKNDEYCDVLLTLGTCNSRASTAAREDALRYPSRRHPDANVFRGLKQRPREIGSVTRECSRPPMSMPSTAAVQREPWKASRDMV